MQRDIISSAVDYVVTVAYRRRGLGYGSGTERVVCETDAIDYVCHIVATGNTQREPEVLCLPRAFALDAQNWKILNRPNAVRNQVEIQDTFRSIEAHVGNAQSELGVDTPSK
jgi:hypothetical protein